MQTGCELATELPQVQGQDTVTCDSAGGQTTHPLISGQATQTPEPQPFTLLASEIVLYIYMAV